MGKKLSDYFDIKILVTLFLNNFCMPNDQAIMALIYAVTNLPITAHASHYKEHSLNYTPSVLV